MLRKHGNARTWALLVSLVLAGSVVPAQAAGPPAVAHSAAAGGWQVAWAHVVAWIAEVYVAVTGNGTASPDYCAGIDPDGGRCSTASRDSSVYIDPNGRPNSTPSSDSSGYIDPNG